MIHASMWKHIVERVTSNPSLAQELLQLYSRDYGKPSNDGAIDVFLLNKIDRFNNLTINGTPGAAAAPPQEDLWSRFSFMNHSCVANTTRTFFGDLLVVCANRKISKGDELFAT